jgi:hypothetical protein
MYLLDQILLMSPAALEHIQKIHDQCTTFSKGFIMGFYSCVSMYRIKGSEILKAFIFSGGLRKKRYCPGSFASYPSYPAKVYLPNLFSPKEYLWGR